ncbi:MAG: bifunctional metallophosphatase/5'-nucleotidase [Holophagales bacterium]|nr:bifunctional metallophosphatase/5'-nucleotidase [Holophagales bacterium]MBK9964676.1 bifunctional metallophosphatase/5'-nucleotidase [Holophagales bacterium]
MTSPRFPAFLVALVLAVPAAAADRTVITVLETSDLHANLLPWDYARGVEGAWGLARVATRVRQIREESPHVLLLDGGDTIQGAPGGWLEARRPSGGPHFMAAAMGALAYDAMAVGNHEFNFGLEVLRRAQKDSSFPWLSANTRNASDGSAAFPEFLVKELGGVRVGVLGLTTPNVPGWEPEPNRPGLKWEDPVETAKRLVPLLRGEKGCDVVVVLFHSGLESDPVTGEPNGTAHENRVVALAREVPGIDLILTGHTHRKLSMTRVHGVPVMQPGRWGEVLARVDFVVERRGGKATVVETRGALLPSDASVAVDPQIAAIAKGPHERALSYLNEPLAIATGPFPGGRARLEDTALLDLVNDTQLSATGADLSLTSLLPFRFEGWEAGPVTGRQVYALYPYENQLVVVEIDGARLRGVLEKAASFYDRAEWRDGRLVVTPLPGMTPYNFDVLQGASYRVDPTAAVGHRVKELRFKGRDVADGDRFSLAVNSYRAQGAGGYTALVGAKVLRTYNDEVRELLVERLRKAGTIQPATDRNWIVAPDTTWAPLPPSGPAPVPAVPAASR